jgi:pantoate--beta-alanine ligase
MMFFTTPNDIRKPIVEWRAAGEKLCLVPTMGAIHDGHLALVKAAKKTAKRVVVSIYVNPTQFAAGEDFDSYPRKLKADQKALQAVGEVDAIYAPSTMYRDQHATHIVPSGVALPMEGESRPHFFTGVATIVFKLFQHVPADYAIFGEKDFQQLAVLRQMVGDLNLPISMIGHPTVRESDGLALSSRNHNLSAEQRAIAPLLYQMLAKTAREIRAGADIQQSLSKAKSQLLAGGFTKIDYLDLRDASNLAHSFTAKAGDRLFVAAWLGKTRLIDNCAVFSHPASYE